MAKNLQEILAPEVFGPILERIRNAPVHHLVNVDGNPHQVRTACGFIIWYNPFSKLLDPDRPLTNTVTCPKCLAAMGDVPVVVEVK